jgi:hypothetical protein
MPPVDKYSIATVPLEQKSGPHWIGNATGFLWVSDGKYFLITNWHVVTGRSSSADETSKSAAPDRLSVLWYRKASNGPDHTSTRRRVDELLRDPNGHPRWFIHPQFGKSVDVIALPVTLADDVEPYPINKMPSHDLAVNIGMDVFVIGYPYGLGPDELPVWKRGSIASEPNMYIEKKQNHIFLDTASRPGMSGGPVIRRSYGSHHMRDGTSTMGEAIRTKFVGVYSGRVTAFDPLDAQLGLMWPAEFVNEIVAGEKLDT